MKIIFSHLKKMIHCPVLPVGGDMIKTTRFKMENKFKPIASAEAWQLSNPPVLSLAAIRGFTRYYKNGGWYCYA
ncbi:MAG: hypothetical protein Q9M92_06085 [Enterobacterales bacterium]|nr:hypothetical protein [Enterobacterales bacterium]